MILHVIYLPTRDPIHCMEPVHLVNCFASQGDGGAWVVDWTIEQRDTDTKMRVDSLVTFTSTTTAQVVIRQLEHPISPSKRKWSSGSAVRAVDALSAHLGLGGHTQVSVLSDPTVVLADFDLDAKLPGMLGGRLQIRMPDMDALSVQTAGTESLDREGRLRPVDDIDWMARIDWMTHKISLYPRVATGREKFDERNRIDRWAARLVNEWLGEDPMTWSLSWEPWLGRPIDDDVEMHHP